MVCVFVCVFSPPCLLFWIYCSANSLALLRPGNIWGPVREKINYKSRNNKFTERPENGTTETKVNRSKTSGSVRIVRSCFLYVTTILPPLSLLFSVYEWVVWSRMWLHDRERHH